MTILGPVSPLDLAHPEHQAKPFFDETLRLLRGVRDHDFDVLADLCDDDFGIVDIAPDGTNVAIRTRAEWEDWFHGLFGQLDMMKASTDSEILAYDAIETPELGFSVLEFRQSLSVGDLVASFDCITRIVWKCDGERWREARWHGSVLSSDVPTALLEG